MDEQQENEENKLFESIASLMEDHGMNGDQIMDLVADAIKNVS
jgi:hypothetical protein